MKGFSMKLKLKQLFGAGVFGTGWTNAGICILLAVGVFLSNELYALLNHGPAVLNLQTPIDTALPVVPIFVIPYVSLNPFVYATLILFLLFRTKVFQSACLAVITVMMISFAFYFFAQSEVVRPVLLGTDLFTRMIRDVYAGDNPFNDFPSLHTSVSTILAIHWWRVDRRVGIPVAIWTMLIVASTVLIKQHYIADLIFGLALAFSLCWLYMRLLLRKA
jgi:membrane-associated phospholipid phosphatase